MDRQGDEFIQDFAVQLFPAWVAVVILIVVGFGLWKLAKIMRAARSR